MTINEIGLAYLAVSAVFLVVCRRHGFGVPLLLTLIGAVLGVRHPVVSFGISTRIHSDIAGGVPVLATFDVLVIVGLIWVVLTRRLTGLALLVLPGYVLLWIFGPLMWPMTPDVGAGQVHLSTVLGAFVLGAAIRPELATSQHRQGFLAWCLAGLFVAESILAGYQILTTGGRAAGTGGHPALLGKAVILLLPVILLLGQTAQRRTRTWATVALVAAVVATGATVSRANVLGAVALILSWSLLLPSRGTWRQKLSIPILLALISLPFLNELMTRFLADPDGGSRPALREAGLEQISRNPWIGTGPNNFVVVVREWSVVVDRTGYPVHNALLLLWAEVGLAGAVLILLPVIALLCRAIARAPRDAARHPVLAARAVLCLMVGLAPVAWTGWGLLQQPTMQLAYLMAGYLLVAILEPSEESAPPSRAVTEAPPPELAETAPPMGRTRVRAGARRSAW